MKDDVTTALERSADLEREIRLLLPCDENAAYDALLDTTDEEWTAEEIARAMRTVACERCGGQGFTVHEVVYERKGVEDSEGLEAECGECGGEGQ